MARGWLFLSVFLDVFPWLFLQYMPFRDKLRFSYPKTIAICASVLIAWQLGLALISVRPYYTPDLMLAYRFAQLGLLAGLSLFMMRSPFSQSAFVLCLMFPCVMLVLTTACFIAQFLPAFHMTPYMATSLLRFALSCAVFPFMLAMFKKVFIPIMNVQDDGIWRYAWPIPASFTLVSLAYTGNDFETAGVALKGVIGHGFLFGGTLAACLLLFRTIRQEEKRLHAAEEAEKSKLLLSLEAEQYRALVESVAQARQTRHDFRQHLSMISAMAQKGDMTALQRYLSRYTQTVFQESDPALCENQAAGAILHYYLAQAAAAKITATTAACIPADIGVEDTDLAILLGNLLENAVEACVCLPEPARRMEIKARTQGRRLFFILSNACDEDAARSRNGTLSRKRGYQETGVGLMSVRAVAAKYHGEVKLEQAQNRFTVSVMLEMNRA